VAGVRNGKMSTVNELDQPLDSLGWVPEPKRKLLQRFGVVTLRNLLEHYPRRYEDRARFSSFPTGGSEEAVCIRGVIQKVSARYFGSRKIVEVTVGDPLSNALSGRLVCRWFNQHYIQRMLAAGQEIVVFGRPKDSRNRIYMDHPEFEVVEDEGEQNIHMGRITPIYPLTEGLRQRALRALLFRAVEELDRLPQSPLTDWDLIPEYEALRKIHFPETWEARQEARKALALREFVAMQIAIEQRRRKIAALIGERHVASGRMTERFLEALPYRPTAAQVRVIGEIWQDMARKVPMSRLLQGDVGAGKTLVAAAAMLYAVESGYEAALMAPTQVLAEQHFENFQRWLAPLDVRITLRTGGRIEASHLELQGDAQILIGTHALLYDTQQFRRLGLVVVDEQHKFGVLQRAKLLNRTPVPDLLVMTATPIPRTLAMTVYGDLDVSLLDEKPANRRPVITRIRSAAKIPEAAAFIRERVASGRQAFIVYPVIDESDTLAAKAASTEFIKWEKLLAPHRCGLLHGRLSVEDREQVMEQFRAGKTDILVTTTVIEVGVDVPNATIMLIENAERFGLAQLHQLRGRIGRGRHQSYCVLLTDREDAAALDKLSVLEKSENGFEIAEADLRLRGPGDMLGTAQSGLPPLRLASLIEDADLLVRAKTIAKEVLKADPALQSPQHQRFTRIAIQNIETGTSLAN
jgi:ATP-dependent DNA helicase RecG